KIFQKTVDMGKRVMILVINVSGIDIPKAPKPMRKSSRYCHFLKESRRRWDCGKEYRSEWTFEGKRKT
ncbi:MAG: hypothetical protein K6G22_02155, partial [Lachnospiraceae bacterium]|nr:hypothetical protein [Lachnospiraceae bacterium]